MIVKVCVFIFPIFTAYMGGNHFIDQLQLLVRPFVEFNDAPAIAAVPKPFVLPAPIRCLIVDQQHILLFAGDLRIHQGVDILLDHMPVHIFFVFMEAEFRFYIQPDLGEVK